MCRPNFPPCRGSRGVSASAPTAFLLGRFHRRTIVTTDSAPTHGDQPMADLTSPVTESSATNPEPRRTGKRGGDRRSEHARTAQTAKQPNLVATIAARRQHLDQVFFNDLRKLRREHGDAAVDRALAAIEQQRNAVAVAPRKPAEEGRGFSENACSSYAAEWCSRLASAASATPASVNRRPCRTVRSAAILCR